MLLLLVFARFGSSYWVGSCSLDVRLSMVEHPKSWRLQLQPTSLVGKRIISLIQLAFGPPNWCFHGLLAGVGCPLASSLAGSSAALQGTLFPSHCWFLVLLADHYLLVCSFLYVNCCLALILCLLWFVQGSLFPLLVTVMFCWFSACTASLSYTFLIYTFLTFDKKKELSVELSESWERNKREKLSIPPREWFPLFMAPAEFWISGYCSFSPSLLIFCSTLSSWPKTIEIHADPLHKINSYMITLFLL
jgi:hypothetical protein